MYRRFFVFLWLAVAGMSVSAMQTVKIAIISDAHIQDTCRVRSMAAQLISTRLFNENYFAFLSALDDVAKRHIRYVLLTGDLTDNGQVTNVMLVDSILRQYTEKYDMQFFIMTGNHDPARPLAQYIAKDGEPWGNVAGYPEIHKLWADYGFMPKERYKYWATPFSRYEYKNYTFKKALAESQWEGRTYRYNGLKPSLHDGSYVVEPIDGLWLLGIDAAVYHPVSVRGDSIEQFTYAATGYNEVLEVKSYLLPWLKKVAADARRYGKTLVAFSHYPMVDYNSGADAFIQDIAAKGKFDVARFPIHSASEQLADAGITLHFGGHIHLNDDTVFVSSHGNRLRNVQTPSTAGYVPAYKILTIDEHHLDRINTIRIDSVKGFDTFFARYRKEYVTLKRQGLPVWNDSILTSSNYHDYCLWHLRELTRLRYLPADFKPVVVNEFARLSGSEIFERCGIDCPKTLRWTGFDFLVDFYKLRYAYWLAYSDISRQRIDEYRALIEGTKALKGNEDEFLKFVYSLCRITDAKLSKYDVWYRMNKHN